MAINEKNRIHASKLFRIALALILCLAVIYTFMPQTAFAANEPDLVITKMHTGNFQQGQVGAYYTITVSNTGGTPTSGAITVMDNVPAGLTPTAASGSGWTCNISGQNVTASRSDPLAVGASYPAITLTVNVAPVAPTSITNTAMVSGGGEINTANNSVSDPTTIEPGPDLIIIKSHTGNFTQGQTGAQYTMTVLNTGTAPTSGAVTVTDTVPVGLTLTAASGAGWTCGISGGTLSATRTDPLASGASYPVITLTVDVAPAAAATVINTAVVSGGGDMNPGNNMAVDPTTIGPGPDLSITKSHTGNFTQGQTGALYTIVVTNNGGMPTSGAVTVADTVPAGLTPTAAAGTGWTCNIVGQTVSATRSDPLAAGASYAPITLTVNVATNAPPSLINTATVLGSADVNPANNASTEIATVMPGTDLDIIKSHTGSFLQGQTGAQYTITVSNTGGFPSSGAVTVTDTVPAGLTPTAASGTGWTCSIAGQTVSATRSDPLAPGASYAPIALTVNVAADAPVNIINTAVVSLSTDLNAANNTATDTTAITAVNAPAISGPAGMTLTQGYTETSTGTYTITGTGTVSVTPSDARFTWDAANKKLTIPTGLDAGTYPVTLTASNGINPDATLIFTLTVEQPAPVSITGLPGTYALYTGGRVSWTPQPLGGSWSYDNTYLSMTTSEDNYSFKALKEGSTTVTYTINGISHTVSITINKPVLPQTGDNAPAMPWLMLMLAALCGIGAVMFARKKEQHA